MAYISIVLCKQTHMSGKRKRKVDVEDGDGSTCKKSCPLVAKEEQEESDNDGEMDAEEISSLSPDFCCQGTVEVSSQIAH